MNRVISWDQYFMGIALLSAKRSKDPKTRVGSVIVNRQNRIVSIGYNGFPSGCDDKLFPWEKSENLSLSKHAYVVHAELNAILNSQANMEDTIIYVTHFPCNECTKAIIQVGIKEIVYLYDENKNQESGKASMKMIKATNLKLRKLTEITKIEIGE